MASKRRQQTKDYYNAEPKFTGSCYAGKIILARQGDHLSLGEKPLQSLYFLTREKECQRREMLRAVIGNGEQKTRRDIHWRENLPWNQRTGPTTWLSSYLLILSFCSDPGQKERLLLWWVLPILYICTYVPVGSGYIFVTVRQFSSPLTLAREHFRGAMSAKVHLYITPRNAQRLGFRGSDSVHILSNQPAKQREGGSLSAK